MKTITLKRFSNRINSVLVVDEKRNGIVQSFRLKFGDEATLPEFVLWLRKINQPPKNRYEALMLATNDGELTQDLIDNGADPHAYDDEALSYAAEDGDGGKVESLKILVKYKPSLQALENALACMLHFSWSSNPTTENLLRGHIKKAKKESKAEKTKRAKTVPEVKPVLVMGPFVI